MLEMESCQLQLWHMLGSNQRKTMKLLARLGIVRQVSHGFARRARCVAKHVVSL